MTQSAKRYGLDALDPELESRIRRIEVALAALGPQTASSNPTTTSRGGGTPPQITGLSLSGTSPGSFTFAWSAATISDLRRYDISIAEDVGFTTGVQSKIAALNEYAFTTGDTSVTRTYFVRVRAVNTSDTPGAYSATLNTTTGQVTTEDILDAAVTDPKIESTEVASGRVQGHLAGAILSNGTDTANDIDVSSFSARDEGTDALTFTGSGLTKQIDAVWASGTNAGGLPSALSPASISTWYHFFVISNADGTTVDAGFDTSLTASNLLSDSSLTLYRRVGSVFVNSGGTIDQFLQIGDWFTWDVIVAEWATSNPGTSRVTETIRTPLGVKMQARLSVDIFDSAGNDRSVLVTDLDGTDTTASATARHLHVNASGSDNNSDSASIIVVTNTSSQIGYRMNTSGSQTTVSGRTEGWIDRRGQDA